MVSGERVCDADMQEQTLMGQSAGADLRDGRVSQPESIRIRVTVCAAAMLAESHVLIEAKVACGETRRQRRSHKGVRGPPAQTT